MYNYLPKIMNLRKRLRKIMGYSLAGVLLHCISLNLLVASGTEAQNYQSVKDIYISVELRDASLEETFDWISDHTVMHLNYDQIHVQNTSTKINYRSLNGTLEKLLLHISKTARLKFKQVNNSISVDFLKEANAEPEVEVVLQGIRVTGKVTGDDAPEGIPGVNVVLKGSLTGTVTDLDGNFVIEVPDQNAILVFSSVGYEKQEIVVGNQTVINLEMATELTSLKEIVVIGYGIQKKEDATGAVTAIDSEQFNKGAIVSPQELLAGRTAGVQIVSQGGAPGTGSTIRIRGGSSLRASNDPLIIIDGVPVDNDGVSGMRNPLSVVNPNDIESFSVLKDASATAIYGSRASNGVIIITTKRGKKGDAVNISYTGNVAIHTVTGNISVFDGEAYANLVNERVESGLTPTEASTLLGTANTDWQDQIFETALGTDHNLSANGAVGDMTYRASYGYTNQNGILKTSNFERHSASIGLDPSFFNDHLKISFNFKGMFAQNTFPNEGAIGSAVTFDPTKPVRDPESPWGGYFFWGQQSDPELPITIAPSNPVAMIELTDNRAQVNRYLTNIKFDYKFHFLEDLNFNLNLATDRSTTDGREKVPETATWEYDPVNGNGRDNKYDQEKINDLLEAYLKYNSDFGGNVHNLDFLLGYSWQHFWRTSDDFVTNAAGDFIRQETQSKSENFLISYYGRLNYGLLDKYLFTFTLRQDGSSRFAEGNQWGVFPSAAFAWKINQESFLKSSESLSELKLRLGYGITGQQDVVGGDYPAIARVRESESTAAYQFGDNYLNTIRYEAYDANLKWEETTTINAGLDFGFFEDRVTGSVDFYHRETRDLLNEIPVPIGTNFSNRIITNIGNLENTGFELSLNGYVIDNNRFSWNAGFNLTRNENKITKLYAVDDPASLGVLTGGIGGGVGNTIQVHSIGYPAFSFFALEQVYNAADQPIEGLYVDQNGDGIINDNDRIRYKNPAPDFYMGFSSRFNWDNWDFSFNARANVGNYVYDNVSSQIGQYANLYNSVGYINNLTTNVTNANFENPQYISNYYLHNASFFRMDNMSLGYMLNSVWNDRSSVYLNFTVQNAFVITEYKGLDPEVDGGIDNNIYPRPRTFLFSVNVNF
jgi:TonB-linked SusC/RagA family outer membrane protein